MADDLKRRDDREEHSPAQRLVLAASIALTLGLFAFLGWQAWVAPDGAAPRVEVMGMEQGPDGEGAVRVRLSNDGGVGLQDATVEVTCGDAEPVELQFTHVPAGGHREGHAVCEGGEPDASVVAWREA